LADHRQDVEWSPDDESFLLFLQIVNPSLNWASSPGSQIQRIRTMKEPFPFL
jgi:hypothetical protein